MVKDGNKPKGRTSAYAFFVLFCRDEFKKKKRTTRLNFARLSMECSQQWKSMSAVEKKKFEDMATADNDRYEREMKNHVPLKVSAKKRRKRKKDSRDRKRPPSAFALFCLEHRADVKSAYPRLSTDSVAKKLGEMWAGQSMQDRAPYELKANELHQKYQQEENSGQEEDSGQEEENNKEDEDDEEEIKGVKRKRDPDEEEEEEEDDD